MFFPPFACRRAFLSKRIDNRISGSPETILFAMPRFLSFLTQLTRATVYLIYKPSAGSILQWKE